MYQTLRLICVLWAFTTTESAKILGVFPAPSISHQVVFRVLTKELAKRGHEVVVITTDPAFPKGQTPENLTEIDVHDISYNFYKDIIENGNIEFEIGRESQWLSQLRDMHKFFKIVEIQIKSEPVQKLIREKMEFDLILLEAYIRPVIIFSHIFKAPVIQVSSFGATLDMLETVGASTHVKLYPIPHRQRLYNLSLWEKIQEYFNHVQLIYYNKVSVELEDIMLKRIFGSNIPSINELVRNVDMLFLNIHPIWMNNQPMPPNVIFMGGVHQNPAKEIPQDLKSYLDLSLNGVIYVSFGTNIQPFMFPPERLQVLVETLSELPYDILFKWNDDELPGKTENIKISKWLPQSDLLRHPKVKAFVMQGGLQSTDEAIAGGVPLICIPLIGDQWYNAEKYVHFKIGYKLSFLTFTKPQLKNAIETVIKDTSYRENIVKLRERMNDQPQTALERAVWWIEYVIRHGGAKHLRTPAANMSRTEYFELELVLVILICALTLLTGILYGVVLLGRHIFRFGTSNVKTKRS